MSRTTLEALRNYEELLIYMSFMAHAKERKSWQGTPDLERAKCARAFEEVKGAWPSERQGLLRLQELNQECLAAYEAGKLEAGDFKVRDIQELLASLRDGWYRDRAKD